MEPVTAPAGNNGKATTPQRAYAHNGLYGGTVRSQVLTSAKSGDHQLRLSVLLDRSFNDGWRPVSGGHEPLPPAKVKEVTVFMTFNPGNRDGLNRDFAVLRSYGFVYVREDGRDLYDLHPDQDPEYRFDMHGKEVALLCQYSGAPERDWWRLKPMADAGNSEKRFAVQPADKAALAAYCANFGGIFAECAGGDDIPY